jgi:hypothetical protein
MLIDRINCDDAVSNRQEYPDSGTAQTDDPNERKPEEQIVSCHAGSGQTSAGPRPTPIGRATLSYSGTLAAGLAIARQGIWDFAPRTTEGEQTITLL